MVHLRLQALALLAAQARLQALVLQAAQARLQALALQAAQARLLALALQAALAHRLALQAAVLVQNSVSGTKMTHVLYVLTRPAVGATKMVKAVSVALPVKAKAEAVA